MRRSPGSPSQMIAALLRRAPRTWRSTQLTLAFSVPPTNHFACGGFHSSTRVHGVNHSSSAAKPAQNAFGIARRRGRRPPRRARWPARGTRRTARTCDLPAGDRRSRRSASGRPWRIRIPDYALAAGSGGGSVGPPSAGGTSLRKNAAPSTPPSVAKMAPHEEHAGRNRTRAERRIRAELTRASSCTSGGMSRALRAKSPTSRCLERRHQHDSPRCETINQTNGADDAGEKPGAGAAPDGERARIVLLIEVGGQHAAADRPTGSSSSCQGSTIGSADSTPMNRPPRSGRHHHRLISRSTRARDA